MPKQTEADKRYTEWKAKQEAVKSNQTNITLEEHECAIIIRRDASVETYLKIQQAVLAPELLALGLSWACENEEWKKKIMRKAREKLIRLCDEEGVATSATPYTQHD